MYDIAFLSQGTVPASVVVWPDVVKTIAAVLALPMAALTFWLGYRQKERERTRSYYHKVVVDVVLPSIITFFDEQIEGMTVAGTNALKGASSARKTIPRSCTMALADFGTKLFHLQDIVTDRTLIFDERVTTLLLLHFEALQDDLAAWFNDVNLHKRRDLEEIRHILRGGQRVIIKQLYRGEFRDF